MTQRPLSVPLPVSLPETGRGMGKGKGKVRKPCLFLRLLLSIAVCGPGLAADNPSSTTFTLTLSDGTTASGPLEQIDDDWAVRLGGAKSLHASGMQVIAMRQDKAPFPSLPKSEQVIFANGDRLPGSIRELSGERLRMNAHIGKDADFTVPLSSVSIIWVTAPDGIDRPDRWRRRLTEERRSRDRVYLRNGDIIEGIVNSITGANLKIESAKKEITVPFPKVAVIAFNSELLRPLHPKSVHGRLVLKNGARLTLASGVSDGRTFTGKTLGGGEVSVSLDQVIALDWLGGCAMYLSDLKPRTYQFRSYLEGMDWPYVKDGSAAETDIRLGGRLFDKGVGVHTSSRLTYALDKDAGWFQTLVGMDDLVGKEGTARIQVLLDGKPQDLNWHGRLDGPAGPRFIRMPIKGAKELTLMTDFGDFGDVQGCVDWAEARLIQKQK
ncbi:MAG TPA: NPCBM/NEW2 domain-containing protein [Gemmataceae bacterium]|nr:NPCBM/NEW2 domain-containing protein [Gemmataceae bacterium]